MTFKFECPHCCQRIAATIELIGTPGLCPSCNQAFTVPMPPEGVISGATAATVRAGNENIPLLIRWSLLRWLCQLAAGMAVLIGIAIAVVNFTTVYFVLADKKTNQEQERTRRITMAVMMDSTNEKNGGAHRVPFALAAGRLGAAFEQLKDSGPNSPVSAAARFHRFNQSVTEVGIYDFPNDVLPVWKRYVVAVTRLNQRFGVISPSDGMYLLTKVLNGGKFEARPDTQASLEIERDLTEYQAAVASLVEAQDRYRVQEVLDYINHGK